MKWLILFLAIVSGDIAQAADAAKSSWPMVTYVWVAVWSALAGLVSFYQKVKAGAARWLNFSEVLGEIATSSFVGVITGLLCEWAEFPMPLSWALIGLTGHMGARALFWFEKATQRFVEKKLDITVETPEK